MDTKTLIEQLGGRAKVISETGLSRGRISQWATADKIPAPWLKYFQAKYKKLPWHQYTGNHQA